LYNNALYVSPTAHYGWIGFYGELKALKSHRFARGFTTQTLVKITDFFSILYH